MQEGTFCTTPVEIPDEFARLKTIDCDLVAEFMIFMDSEAYSIELAHTLWMQKMRKRMLRKEELDLVAFYDKMGMDVHQEAINMVSRELMKLHLSVG